MTTDQVHETVASHLCAVLADIEVRTVFGLPGITNLPVIEALRLSDATRFVVTRHEQCAGHMADASARMGANLGVLLVDLGPGLANALTAILAAGRDSVPLLVIAGNEHQTLIGREVWHEMPDTEVFGPVTRYCGAVPSAEAFPRYLRQAIQAATTARPGPAFLSVPKNLWSEPVGAPRAAFTPTAAPAPDRNALSNSLALLRQASRPVVVAGARARRGACPDAVARLCETWSLPLVTSPNGRGVLDEAHPLCMGHAGRFGQRQASKTLLEADTLLVLGCRLDDLTTHDWHLLNDGQRVIQVDPDAHVIGQNWPTDISLVSDVAAFAEAAADAIGDGPRPGFWSLDERFAERTAERAAFLAIDDPLRVKPQAVMRHLEGAAPPDTTVVMGGGRFQQFAGEWLVRDPLGFFYAANSGTVGFALSAAIGVAIEHPHRTVLCILGDGDFMMHSQELETAIRERANVKIVILNDFAYGAMLARQATSYGTEYSNPDFAELAAVYGAVGRRVSHGGDITASVGWLFDQRGPAVLDVIVDRDETRSLLFGHDIGDKAAIAG
jgi:acetolactate synthase-1/2/3 large subunit